jgi:hypothetical protein
LEEFILFFSSLPQKETPSPLQHICKPHKPTLKPKLSKELQASHIFLNIMIRTLNNHFKIFRAKKITYGIEVILNGTIETLVNFVLKK